MTFTVFTPVYNRAHTLHRVYDSLVSQTFRDFEWLVVDDGSTDASGDLVRAWAGEADFSIRYIRKENGGKHTATNIGVSEALGRFFLTLDSDDACLPEALERLLYHWNSIPEESRDSFSAVTALCMHPDGTIEGTTYPESPFDSDSLQSNYRLGIQGEKWGFQRTDVMRRYPYPEFPGERFVPESLVWNRIAREYRTRYVNEALRIYYPESDSLSSSVLAIRARSPEGTSLMYNELSTAPIPLSDRVKAVINYLRFSLHGRKSAVRILKNTLHPLAGLCLLPAAYLLFLRDRKKLRRSDASR